MWVSLLHTFMSAYHIPRFGSLRVAVTDSCATSFVCSVLNLSTLEGQQVSLTAEPSLQLLKWKFTLLIWNFTNNTQFLFSHIGHAHFISQQIFIITLFIKICTFISIKVKNIFKGICEIMTIIAIEVLTWSKMAKWINTLHTRIYSIFELCKLCTDTFSNWEWTYSK